MKIEPMKITEVRTRNLGVGACWLPQHFTGPVPPFQSITETSAYCTLVEIESDDGTVGIGTAGAMHGGAKELIDQYYAPIVLGEDPRRHEFLWQQMYRSTVRFARSGSPVAAIAGIDIACWDLHGKAEAKPVYELIGGRTQTTIPCYVSRLYASADLEELAAEARAWKAAGFSRMKQRFGFGPADGHDGIERNVALVRTVREAVGDEVELAADAYMGWDVGYAMEMAGRLREYGLSWIEEPLMPHAIDGYAELKLRCPWQRWSWGEHSYTKWEFSQIIARRAADILQPDANRAGGITEMLKICTLAETAGLPVIPHSNDAHNLHVAFSKPPHVCPVLEYFPKIDRMTGNELIWRDFVGHAEADAGTLTLGDQPGLGIALNEATVMRSQVGEVTVTRL